MCPIDNTPCKVSLSDTLLFCNAKGVFFSYGSK
nr:MAG TPA: hypothetical protein [Caudoviricetes sp.]